MAACRLRVTGSGPDTGDGARGRGRPRRGRRPPPPRPGRAAGRRARRWRSGRPARRPRRPGPRGRAAGRAGRSGAGRDEPNDSAEAKPAGVGADPGFGDGVAAARTVKASVVSSGAGVATGFGEGFGAGFGAGLRGRRRGGPRGRTCGRRGGGRSGGRRPGPGRRGRPGRRPAGADRHPRGLGRDGRGTGGPDGLGRRCGPDGLGRRCGAHGRGRRSAGPEPEPPGPEQACARSGRPERPQPRRGGLDRLGAVGLVGLVSLLVAHLADHLVGRPLRRRTGPGGAHGDRHDLLDRRGHRRRGGRGRPAAADHLTGRGDEVGDADEAPEREHEELHDRRRVADHRELHAGDAEPGHAEHEGEPRARRHLPAGPRAGDRRRCAPLRLPAHTYLLDGSDDPHHTDRTDTGGGRTVRVRPEHPATDGARGHPPG